MILRHKPVYYHTAIFILRPISFVSVHNFYYYGHKYTQSFPFQAAIAIKIISYTQYLRNKSLFRLIFVIYAYNRVVVYHAFFRDLHAHVFRRNGIPMQHDKRVFTVQIIYQLVKLLSRHLIVILFPCYKCDLSLPLSSRIAHRSTHLFLTCQHNMIHSI